MYLSFHIRNLCLSRPWIGKYKICITRSRDIPFKPFKKDWLPHMEFLKNQIALVFDRVVCKVVTLSALFFIYSYCGPEITILVYVLLYRVMEWFNTKGYIRSWKLRQRRLRLHAPTIKVLIILVLSKINIFIYFKVKLLSL